MWTHLGPGPARYWARRMAHETAVHRADGQIALGQRPQIDPVTAAFLIAADRAAQTYVHALQATPATFLDAWKNNWPAYVQNAMSTKEFLDKMSAAGIPKS